MRSRGLVMLMIAVVVGLLAVALAARWVRAQGGDRVAVAVTNTDVPLGTPISAEMVRLVDWPLGALPPGSFTDIAKVQGRVVISTLQKGEPVLEARLAPIGTKGGLAAVVPEGKRAMTVRVNDVVGVAGFALPGTYVDVLVNTQSEGAKSQDKDQTISKIVLERILVLAAAQEADRDTTKPKVVNAVTLELTPEQAELLDLARSVGTLSLVLRNQSEKTSGISAGATKNLLLGIKAPPPAPEPASAPPPAPRKRVAKPAPAPAPEVAAPPPPPPPMAPPIVRKDCVEVIRGMSKVTECF